MRRRCFLLGVLLVLQTISMLPSAQAARGPGNSWTQLDNHDWPTGSSNPSCSPCVRWPKYFYSGRWEFSMGGAPFFHSDAVSAMKEWSGQPYPSPIFEEGPRGCGGDVCLAARAMPPNSCGRADVTYNSARTVIRAVVYLNTQAQRGYADGPAGSGGCDVRYTYRHEIGHVFSEGHSAVQADLMWPGNNNVEHVDGDAQSELRAVYGTFSTGSSGCPCSAIQTSKMKLLQEAAALDGVVSGRQGFPSAA